MNCMRESRLIGEGAQAALTQRRQNAQRNTVMNAREDNQTTRAKGKQEREKEK